MRNAIDKATPSPSIRSATAIWTRWANRVALTAAGLAGTLLVLYATNPYGAGLSSDSVAYISAAQSLLDGQGLWRVHDVPFTSWPPLFPLLLAALGVGGADLLTTARIVNAVIFGAIVVVTAVALRQSVRSRLLVVLGTVAILASPVLQSVCVYAWSEPLFVLLCLLCVLGLAAFRDRPSFGVLLAASCAAALAFLTRYSGASLVLTGLTVILLHRSLTIRRKISSMILFAAVSVAPTALWLLRNYLLTGKPAGNRSGSRLGLVEALKDSAGVFAEWVIPQSLSTSLVVLVLITTLPLGLACSCLALRESRRLATPRADLLVPAVFGAAYMVLLTAMAIRVAFDPISTRLLIPVYPVAVILVVTILQYLYDWALPSAMRRGMWPAIATVGLIAWLICSTYASWIKTHNWRDKGVGGYATPAWQSSPLMAYLRSHPLQGQVFSNGPDALWLFTGMKSRWSPFTKTRMDAWASHLLSEEPSYLVWLTRKKRDYVRPPQELAHSLHLEPLVEFSDGGVYLISKPREHP